MIIVLTSDWHEDWKTSNVPRAEDVCKAALRSVEVARDVGADAYGFCGDLADPDDPLAVLRATRLFVEVLYRVSQLPKKPFVFAIPGNHDVGEDGTGTTTLEPIKGLPHTTMCLFDQPAYYPCVGDVVVDLIALPFVPTSHDYDPAEFVRTCREKMPAQSITLVVGHLSIPGVQPGEEVKDLARGRNVVLPLEEIAKLPGKVVVVNGHYHRAQTYEDKMTGVRVHIPGSLVRLTHGEEEHEPSILVLEV